MHLRSRDDEAVRTFACTLEAGMTKRSGHLHLYLYNRHLEFCFVCARISWAIACHISGDKWSGCCNQDLEI